MAVSKSTSGSPEPTLGSSVVKMPVSVVSMAGPLVATRTVSPIR